MFRFALRPTPIGFTLGVIVIAFWALLWLAFFARIASAPETPPLT